MAILCYHAVESDWRSPLALPPASFLRHCAWLARRRHVVDCAEAVQLVDRSWRLRRGLAALTFDDGYAGIYEHAFPILARFKLPATVFLVAQTLAPGGRSVDWVDTPPPAALRTLSADEVREMQAAGISFGSHSLAHRDLTALLEQECERDLKDSRLLLEDVLHRPIRLLAYPRGRHDERVRRAAQRAGFSHAFTLPEGPEAPGPYAIPRVGIWAHNGVGALRLKSSRWYLGLRTGRVYRSLRGQAKDGHVRQGTGVPD
jgi:peptidoglycan/xylan/chitin deacetylase (PgdA/CDA1 family)